MSESEVTVIDAPPVTRRGARRGNRNAVTHGLTALSSVLSGESRSMWDLFERGMLVDLAPAGAVEEILAHRVIACAWRMLRAERLDGALRVDAAGGLSVRQVVEGAIDAAEDAAGGEFARSVPDAHSLDGLAKLTRYETAIERAFYRALSALRAEQDARRAAARKPAVGFGPEAA